MYKKGDTGVPADEAKYEDYKTRTEALVSSYGGQLQGKKVA